MRMNRFGGGFRGEQEMDDIVRPTRAPAIAPSPQPGSAKPSRMTAENDPRSAEAQRMMRMIVGLEPNPNNYTLQDAIGSLKQQIGMTPAATPPASAISAPANRQGGGGSMPAGMAQQQGSAPAQGFGTLDYQKQVGGLTGPISGVGALNNKDGMALQNSVPGGMAPAAPRQPAAPAPAVQTGMPPAQAGMPPGKIFKKGGSVQAFAKGGKVGGRGDGIAQRGKTKGTMR